jgi:hypothetical protein
MQVLHALSLHLLRNSNSMLKLDNMVTKIHTVLRSPADEQQSRFCFAIVARQRIYAFLVHEPCIFTIVDV